MSLALAWCAHAQWAHKTGGFPFSKSRKICYVNDTSSDATILQMHVTVFTGTTRARDLRAERPPVSSARGRRSE